MFFFEKLLCESNIIQAIPKIILPKSCDNFSIKKNLEAKQKDRAHEPKKLAVMTILDTLPPPSPTHSEIF